MPGCFASVSGTHAGHALKCQECSAAAPYWRARSDRAALLAPCSSGVLEYLNINRAFLLLPHMNAC